MTVECVIDTKRVLMVYITIIITFSWVSTSVFFFEIVYSNIVKILEQQLLTELNAQTIINAYLHFEALSDHRYNFNCCVCGYHPKVLIMDLNKKINFRCSMSDLQLQEEFDENDADLVDCETFWSNVEFSIIICGFSGRTVNYFKVEPNLSPGLLSLARTRELVPYL